MIQKLRVKFITASMLSLALVLLVILGGVNAMSYQKWSGMRTASWRCSAKTGAYSLSRHHRTTGGESLGQFRSWAMGSLRRPHLNPAFFLSF